MPLSQLRKMIWFFDPIQHEKDDIKKELRALTDWSSKKRIQIVPFYALTPRTISWIGLGMAPDLHQFVPVIEEKMNSMLSEMIGISIASPVVKVFQQKGLREIAQAIKEYCHGEQFGSSLIFASSKSTFEKLYIGSFSETVLFSLDMPSLVVPIQGRELNLENPVLVPFDLTEENFHSIVQFFKKRPPLPHSKVVIYYKATRPDEVFVQTGVHFAGGGWLSMEEYHKNQVAKCQAECDRLKQEIEAFNFEVSTVVDGDFGSVEEGVREYCAKKPVSATILFTTATPASAVLLGSLSRQLLRHPPSPLWILHKVDI
ncbi:MAG: universal stress protein [Bdellovibrionales bacterium]|nr:universal stress protein [Bdellovibrionales bacterium]